MVQKIDLSMVSTARHNRILVTGGLGFIGGHLVEDLLATYPNATVHIIDSFTYAANTELALQFSFHDRVRLFVGDIADPYVVKRAMNGCSLVFHAAAESHVPRSLENGDIFFQTNVIGTETLAQAAFELQVSRFVHLSTDEVYGPTFDHVSEDHGFYPSTPYAVSKAEAERKLEGFRERGLDVCIARPTNAIGIRQHAEKVVPTFVDQALSQKDLTIEGSGAQQRCFLPVTDLVTALRLIAEKSDVSQAYNIPGIEQFNILTLAQRVKGMTGSKSQIDFVADRSINDQSYSICGKKISELGYVQHSSVTDEISKIIKDCKRSGSCERHPRIQPSKLSMPKIEAPSIAFDPIDEKPERSKICYHKPHTSKLEQLFSSDAAKGARFQFGGKYSKLASRILQAQLQVPKIELTNSCTAALEVAAIATGVGPGDEIIVPTYTFAATVTAFQRTGASIVFCDVDVANMMMNVENVSNVVSERTKVVVPVHYGGGVADMPTLVEWCRARHILVVEDAAQAYGSEVNGQVAGTFGDFAAFSFHETKLLQCGHGGALAINTRDETMLARAEAALNRGTNFSEFQNGVVEHYEWTQMGSSFRPTEMQCAQLSAQLFECDTIISKRKMLSQRYADNLEPYMLKFEKNVVSNCSSYVVFTNGAQETRQLIADAELEGIALSSHYKPLHLSKGACVNKIDRQSLPNAGKMWMRVCRLPLHTDMSISDVDRVCVRVLEAVKVERLEAV